MVPTAKETLFSRTFPGLFQDKITIFREQSIQDLKLINQDMCRKAYHIYLM